MPSTERAYLAGWQRISYARLTTIRSEPPYLPTGQTCPRSNLLYLSTGQTSPTSLRVKRVNPAYGSNLSYVPTGQTCPPSSIPLRVKPARPRPPACGSKVKGQTRVR
eukprot:2942908-Rhodomonas_salina.1